jgi:S-adenosylmethionine:tRNA ribosyltransferase-isomerase
LKFQINNTGCTPGRENTTFGKYGRNQVRDNDSLTFVDLPSAADKPRCRLILKDPEDIDCTRYQTVYSRVEVLRLTAGLHFTEAVFDRLRKKNISIQEVTLHVGAGPFQPMKSASVQDHDMHAEYFSVNKGLIRELAGVAPGIVAVGTTSVRTIETLYWLGVKLLNGSHTMMQHDLGLGQWEAYTLPQDIPAGRLSKHWNAGSTRIMR